MLTRIIVIIILQYRQKSNQYVVHLKLVLYVNYPSMKNNNKHKQEIYTRTKKW